MNKEVAIKTVDVPNIDLLRQEEVEACSILDDVVFARYLHRLKDFQLVPVNEDIEKSVKNIRLFKINEMVYQKNENAVHKFATVFSSLVNYDCSVFVIIDSDGVKSDFYLGIKTNDKDKFTPKSVEDVLTNVLKGQFPGVKTENLRKEPIKNLVDNFSKSNLAIVSCVAETKDRELKNNEQYIQGLEKFALAMQGKRYTAIILANSVAKDEIILKKQIYENIYTKLSSFSSMQVSYGRNEALNVSEAISKGVTHSISNATSYSEQDSQTETHGNSKTNSKTFTDSVSESKPSFWGGIVRAAAMAAGAVIGAAGGPAGMAVGAGLGASIYTPPTETKGSSESIGYSETTNEGTSVTKSITNGKTYAETDGNSINNTKTNSINSGENENIQLTVQDRTLKGFLDRIDLQLKRLDECESLGMWNCATYFMGDEMETVQMAATTYQALMKGEVTATETSAINYWNSKDDKFSEIRKSVLNFYHPTFKNNSSSYSEFPVSPIISVSSYELAIHMGMPRKSVCGLPVVEHAEFGKEIVNYSNLESSDKICLGSIFNMGQEDINHKCCLDFKSLASHVFVTGSTGVGKSNTVYKLLEETVNKDVRFMVVEPAKGEYKDKLGKLGKLGQVKVFGTNPKLAEVLRINPFSFPKNIHVTEHIDRLVELFNVCWPMYAAMPAVLKDAVERAYKDCGWDLAISENEHNSRFYPSFRDVADNVKKIIDESDYDVLNKGAYKGALITRLQSLTNGINGLIFVTDELSEKDLFEQNVIVDLSRIGSQETKALIMGMMVLKLQEYHLNKMDNDSNLKHITVLEEAHNLLKRSVVGGIEEGGNLQGKSVEMISNAIAEMRTYGEGFVIVDQAPGLLDMAAIRNTNTKIILRLPDLSDRELVGRAANLNDDQINELARLPRGVAAIYHNEWIEPVLCKVAKFENSKKCDYGPNDSKGDLGNKEDSLEIVKLLEKCERLNVEELEGIKVKMHDAKIRASVQVKILSLLKTPFSPIRMRQIAPIVSELYSDLYEKVKLSYLKSTEPMEWTRDADAELRNIYANNIDEKMRRIILHGLLLQYLCYEVKCEDDLKRWVEGRFVR